MNVSRSRTAFARMFGSALVMQALLSATSLAVGLILIRRVPDEQYGYYVLSMNMVMLATALQNAFIQSHMVVRMSGASAAEHADLIGLEDEVLRGIRLVLHFPSTGLYFLLQV